MSTINSRFLLGYIHIEFRVSLGYQVRISLKEKDETNRAPLFLMGTWNAEGKVIKSSSVGYRRGLTIGVV